MAKIFIYIMITTVVLTNRLRTNKVYTNMNLLKGYKELMKKIFIITTI